jgi:hypothetical protein
MKTNLKKGRYKPAKKVSKQPTKKVSKQTAKKVSKQPTKKVSKQTAKKVSKQPTKKVSKQPAKKVSKQPVKKVTKQPVKKVTKQPVKKISKQPVKKVSKQTVKKISKQPVKKISKQPVKKISKQPVKKVSKKPLKKVSKKPLKKVSKQPVKKVSKKPLKKVSKKPLKKVSKQPVKKVSKQPVKKVSKKPLKKVSKKTALKNYKEVLDLLEKNTIPIDEETNRIDFNRLKQVIKPIRIVTLKRKGNSTLGKDVDVIKGNRYADELLNPTFIDSISRILNNYLLQKDILTFVNVILKIKIVDERLLVKEERFTSYKLLVDKSMIKSINEFNKRVNDFIYEIYFETLHNVIKRFERYVEKDKRVFEGTFTDIDILNLAISDIVKVELDRVLLNIDSRTEPYLVQIEGKEIWQYEGGNYYFSIKTNKKFYE